ncbi:MAG: hypothetical protein AAGA20_08910 [Planctomycetota bacterium]
MADPREGDEHDLFDFPELPESGEFEDVAFAEDLLEHDDDEPVDVAPARPNPPLPAGVADLEEDIFAFDEVFSPPGEAAREPVDHAPGPWVSDPLDDPLPPPAPEPAPAPDPAPAPRPRVERTRPPRRLLDDLPSIESTPDGARLSFDRGPRVLLPEDDPYAASDDRQRMVLPLVACFLLVNTGLLFLAHLANASFHTSIAEATDLLAESIATRAPAPTSAQIPIVVPDLSHSITRPLPKEAAPFQPEAWIDPRDYKNTHEFAVANAKALLAEGRFEDARRLLNHVLANQARLPLAPSLREEIDYLIPLTYYEQGNATGEEADR